MKYNSIARCVWFGDTKLYHLLLGNNHTNATSPVSELAVKHLEVVDGVPQIKDFACFEEEYRVAKLQFFEGERRRINLEFNSSGETSGAFGVLSKKKSKLQAVNRYSELWSSKSPRMRVVGARVSLAELHEVGFDENDDSIGRDEKGNYLLTGDKYFEAVKHSWSRVFGSQEMGLVSFD